MKNILYLILIIYLSACETPVKPDKEPEVGNPTNSIIPLAKKEQVNITILLDLSDRISVKKYPDTPQHYERDMAIVRYISDIFVNSMKKKGLNHAESKFRILFEPYPKIPDINKIAEELQLDLSKIENNKKKRELLKVLSNKVEQNLGTIYDKSINKKDYIGADIWRFFKDKVRKLCIDKDPNYRNILFVLTDGYIYHENSKQTKGNKKSYIDKNDIAFFRNKENWKSLFNKKGYGLISEREDLNNLEVIVMGINSISKNTKENDIVKHYLKSWFGAMQVKYSEIYSTYLPVNSNKIIDDYFKKKK